MLADIWFPSVSNEVPSLILQRARQLAPVLLGSLVAPSATESHPGVWTEDETRRGVVLTVKAPRLGVEDWHLHARLHEGHLVAQWGDEMYFDVADPVASSDELRMSDVTHVVEPTAAEATLRWMVRQLTRPIKVEQWHGRRAGLGPRRVVARRVVFADAGTVLHAWGWRYIRRLGVPDEVLWDDPGPAPRQDSPRG